MPIYEFECSKCGKITTLLTSFESDKKQIRCKACKKMAKRIISRTNFTLKGGGWADSGYSKGGK